MSKPPKVQERKLGRDLAWGLCWQGLNLIEVDCRLRGRRRLYVLVHEMVHHVFPKLSETAVERVAQEMTAVLWAQNYRRCDNLWR